MSAWRHCKNGRYDAQSRGGGEPREYQLDVTVRMGDGALPRSGRGPRECQLAITARMGETAHSLGMEEGNESVSLVPLQEWERQRTP